MPALALIDRLLDRRRPDAREGGLLAPVDPETVPSLGLARLTRTREHFGDVAALFPPARRDVRTGKDATYAALRQAGPAAGVVFLATHAEAADGRSPYVGLDSPLVVLSACHSGAGPVTGDGVIGVSRAFLVEGAAALFLTLHRVVEDAALGVAYRFLELWLGGASQTLGPDGRPRLVGEGGVTLGRFSVYPLTHDELPDLVRRRPDLEGRAFDVVEIPFGLEPLPGSRRYARAEYVVSIDTAGVVAHSLWPETVSTAVDVERSRTFSLGIDLSFVSAPGLQNGRVFRYQELQPVITTRGRGTSRFGWTFLESDGQPLVATGRTVFAVLERPRDTPALSGTLLATAHIRRRSLPSLGPTVARGRPRGFRLNTADGTFELDVMTP